MLDVGLPTFAWKAKGQSIDTSGDPLQSQLEASPLEDHAPLESIPQDVAERRPTPCPFQACSTGTPGSKTQMSEIRVLVADDHLVITDALADALNQFGINVIDAVADGTQLVRRYLELRPAVLVLDLRLRQVRGLDLARGLLRVAPDARIVFYSQFDQDRIVREAYRIGGKAFVTKNTETSVLAEAIIAVDRGATYLLPAIAERLALLSVQGDESPQARLDSRELVVFKKMARGLTNAEIAKEMDLSTKTIGLITQSVKETLGVTRAAEITRLALKYQLIPF